MFDHVVCINLDRRPERWERFYESIPLVGWLGIDRYPAVDSRLAKPPPWFPAVCPDPGAWGCLRTHVRIWENALSGGWEDVLVFEDDAIFCDDFPAKFGKFLRSVPDDWEQLYFGGQHLYVDETVGHRDHSDSPPPQAINDKQIVIRCQRVNRTHAYAMRPSMMQAALDTCSLLPPGMPTKAAYHVDHRLGELHAEHRVYAPWRFLVGQEHGISDVKSSHKDFSRKFWNQFTIRDAEPAKAMEAIA